jgi:hypothetical protein
LVISPLPIPALEEHIDEPTGTECDQGHERAKQLGVQNNGSNLVVPALRQVRVPPNSQIVFQNRKLGLAEVCIYEHQHDHRIDKLDDELSQHHSC